MTSEIRGSPQWTTWLTAHESQIMCDLFALLEIPSAVLVIGFGLPGENAHAPNEWLSMDNFRRGVRAMAALYGELPRPHPDE